MMRFFLLLWLLLCLQVVTAQEALLQGRVLASGQSLAGATVRLGNQYTSTDSMGSYSLRHRGGRLHLEVRAVGYLPFHKVIDAPKDSTVQEWITLEAAPASVLSDVVVTGTMRPVSRLQSPVAVEVYQPQYFRKNPVPSVFECMQQVNGVRPQINCSVCNTGDIHINGLEGPYTMVTIDGMPIVSALGSVYGLFGLPTQLIERIEVVKGPASGLYGAEAIGGLINIITKTAEKAPRFSGQVMSTGWGEHNADLGLKVKAGKHHALTGVHYFRYQDPRDENGDNFTDLTLQHRASLFQKWQFARRLERRASLAGRYFWEDRWGGEMQWKPAFRGSDQVYGESIVTKRWELLGNYQLPVSPNINAAFSATGHRQRSWYGTTPYNGDQRIVFGQLTWQQSLGRNHDLLVGGAGRFNYYDDNSTATYDTLLRTNKPDRVWLPGIFVQDEWQLHPAQVLLLGMRFDHHPVHGAIWTPRIAWKWNTRPNTVWRLNAGTGFRVVNLFTEEHAALTGARAVEIKEQLRPEQSYNVNAQYSTVVSGRNRSVQVDFSAWYSYFRNQIQPDYDTDPNKIIYANLQGYAVSKGISASVDVNLHQRLKGNMGATLQDVSRVDGAGAHRQRVRPVLTERWSLTWALSWSMPQAAVTIDYTGNVYGPMRLPLAGNLDPRPAYSKVWSIQNLQATRSFADHWELFGGVKNLLNWLPAKGLPFLIARAHDPFDKQVTRDRDGKVQATAENPYALTFDPAYVYAPNQGRRWFLGLRYQVK